MTDLEYPPQRKRRRQHVHLEDKEHRILFNGKRDVWEGEPIGDWTEFRHIRIALRRVEGTFEGIVPDSTE